MSWSPQQDAALLKVKHWLNDSSQQVFHLFGYAGTGKTTLAKEIASYISGLVFFLSYTGKAAYVLQKKGCDGATTIHSAIYQVRDKSKNRLLEIEQELQKLIDELTDSGENIENNSRVKQFQNLLKEERENLKHPFFILNPDSDIRNASLIIIDECSMVDAKIATDLLSFGRKILVLGDPAQLPPIGSAGYFTENVNPDVMLEEIHRQATESPIIRMATQVRNERKLAVENYGTDCQVTDKKLDPEFVLSFEQILVGKNVTRFATNRRVRQLLGNLDPYPVIGDRLVCLRNNHDFGLLNGAIFNVSDVGGILDNKVILDITPEGSSIVQSVIAHEHYFLNKGNELPWFERNEAQEFDYGYALTVHKSQGSQWNSVLLFDESASFRKDKWKWLYTGITRAEEKLTIAVS